MSNKYSRYLNGLVSYINDTKPFHSKLTEIQEVYQFSESMNVDIRETWRWDVLMKAYWLYEYFSDGRPTNTFGGQRKHSIHSVTNPLFRGASNSKFTVGSDESTAIDFVPNTYDENSFALSDVIISRNNKNIFLHQGLDYHKSYGAQVFRVRQTHKIGFKEWCGKQEFETSWASDGQHPVIKQVNIPNSDDIRIRSGNAIRLNENQIKILTPGTVIVDGFVSESYYPLIQEKQDEAVLTEATNSVKEFAMDKLNPNSAYSRLKSIFSVIQFQISQVVAPNSQIAINHLQLQIETKIPSDFEELMVFVVAENVPVPSGYAGWRGVDTTFPLNDQKYVETVLYSHSPNLLQNYFTDRGQWEYAGATYKNVKGGTFEIFNVTPNNYASNFEEWSVVAYDEDTASVSGSTSGLIGSVQLGGRFTSNAISFSTKKLSVRTISTGDTVVLTPINKIVVHSEAPLEAWSIIKTDPFGYSRPAIASRRFAFVEDLSGHLGAISILSKTVADGTVIVQKISDGILSVIHENDPRINGTVRIGEIYNDGFIAFKISNGSKFPLLDDERFAIDILNIPPYAQDLSICYTYDCDGYDAENAVYDSVGDPYKAYFKKFEFGFDGTKNFEGGVYEENSKNTNNGDAVTYVQDFLRRLEFGYDSRFLGYDFNGFNLKFTSEDVVDSREWRLRAKPDFTKPLKLHADTPSNKFNLIASLSPGDAYADAIYDAPDSQLPGEGQRSSSDPDLDVDLFLYYSSEFALEYYNGDGIGWVVVDEHVPISTRYTNSDHGMEFTIVPASKEFIGAEVHSSWYDENGEIQTAITFGGDCLTWTVKNPLPICTGANLVSDKVPRVLMHASGFNQTDEFLWRMIFRDPSTYDLNGIGQTTNSGIITPVEEISFPRDGFSYKDRQKSIHYTLIPNEYGFDNGDIVSFYTYKSRPNYLVYGSVSGWQPPAEYNKYYWNGKIGFKITPPAFTFYEGTTLIEGSNNSWNSSDGVFSVNWTAHSIVDTIYVLNKVEDRWVLYRDGNLVASGSSIIDDGFINISVPADKFFGGDYTIVVDSDDFDYAFGQDLTIMKSSGFRKVRTTDVLSIEKSRPDELFMHITDSNAANDMRPESMPIHTFELATDQEPEYKLTDYSPEVDLYSKWIPLSPTNLDIRPSVSEFRDSATEYDIFSTVTNELLVQVVPLDKNTPLEKPDVVFDVEFHEKYLPLNSSLHFLTKGGGPDETISVGMNEKLRIYVLGGIGGLDAMFEDSAMVSMTDSSQFFITTNYSDTIQTLIADNQFQGFLPGYDNLPFDAEQSGSAEPNGYYDAGIVLTDFFQQARLLLISPNRTDAEDKKLISLLGIINPWADLSNLTSLTINDFLDRVRNALPTDEYLQNAVNFNSTQHFGVPFCGVAQSIQENSTSESSAKIVEAFVMTMKNSSGFDAFGMGEFSFDEGSYTLKQVNINSLHSGQGSSFSEFDGIQVDSVTTVRISAPFDLYNKQFKVWQVGSSAPVGLIPEVLNKNTVHLKFVNQHSVKISVI